MGKSGDNPAVKFDVSLVEARLLRYAVRSILLGTAPDPRFMKMYADLLDELNGVLAEYDHTQKPTTDRIQ